MSNHKFFFLGKDLICALLQKINELRLTAILQIATFILVSNLEKGKKRYVTGSHVCYAFKPLPVQYIYTPRPQQLII